jgi:hypothetical protein
MGSCSSGREGGISCSMSFWNYTRSLRSRSCRTLQTMKRSVWRRSWRGLNSTIYKTFTLLHRARRTTGRATKDGRVPREFDLNTLNFKQSSR